MAATVWLGELGLDGRLRPVRGVLPAVIAARDAGAEVVVVPPGNGAEANLISGVQVLVAGSLAEVVHALRGTGEPLGTADVSYRAIDVVQPDLAEVVGQELGRRAIEVAAAGSHHLLFEGVPGAGKTMLAARLPGLLPPLSDSDSVEVTAIHSVAGLLSEEAGLLRHAPLQAPHHTASMAALVGGGSGIPRPGAVSLAHGGVLFLDEAAEFRPSVLDCLRQPLETGHIRLHRVGGIVEYPARFQLVMATNPCACGAATDLACSCSAAARHRYRRRLSGPLLDRIDLQVPIDPVAPADLLDDRLQETTATVAGRVVRARAAAMARWGEIATVNARVPGSLLRSRQYRPAPKAFAALDTELMRGRLSARGCDRVLRLAWTLTDLAERNSPGEHEIREALWLRTGRGAAA